jgi:hypothetical protein
LTTDGHDIRIEHVDKKRALMLLVIRRQDQALRRERVIPITSPVAANRF